MSTWRIRHAGSPESIELPSADRVVAGLRDGDWEGSDELIGPGEQSWKAIEDHPAFSEICQDLEPVKPEPPDETRLDMNPLIDVSLVLLIFFILTTSYDALRRVMDMPKMGQKKETAAKKLRDVDVKARYIHTKVDTQFSFGPKRHPI